jgi:hypothetical protein
MFTTLVFTGFGSGWARVLDARNLAHCIALLPGRHCRQAADIAAEQRWCHRLALERALDHDRRRRCSF